MQTASEIKSASTNAFKQCAFLNSSEIKTDLRGDNIWLSGKVDSYHKKFAIKEAAKDIAGVKHVHLDICVELPQYIKESDANLKDAIINNLRAAIPGNEILVRVYSGIVVLTGIVTSDQQKNDAITAILDIPGILNVWNFIHVDKTAGTISSVTV
jgi:osmotically-inducible protein OsmY